MEKNKELQKKAHDGQMAVKGTLKPPRTLREAVEQPKKTEQEK